MLSSPFWCVRKGVGYLTIISTIFRWGKRGAILWHKILNRNLIKVSYSCMRKVKSIINSHNHKILQSQRSISTKTSSCITKIACPLSNHFLLRNIFYQAIVSSENPELKEKVSFGISETPFKLRYPNHLNSFHTVRYKNDTELSKEIWNFKEKTNSTYSIVENSKALQTLQHRI